MLIRGGPKEILGLTWPQVDFAPDSGTKFQTHWRIRQGRNGNLRPKTRSVFDTYELVDERDLQDATSKLEQYFRKCDGPVRTQYQQLQR